MKIQGPIDVEPEYNTVLTKSEIELILDGLTTVESRYKDTVKGDLQKVRGMIKQFEIIYRDEPAEAGKL